MPQDPSILLIPDGAQFLTAPDGTTAPDVAGTPVDLTGVPLTVAPSYDSVLGNYATVTGFLAPFLGVGNLLPGLLGPSYSGKRLQLIGSQEGDVAQFLAPGSEPGEFVVIGLLNLTLEDTGRLLNVDGAANPGNNGSFVIGSVLSPTVAVILNPFAVVEAGLSWRRLSAGGEPVPLSTNTGNAGIFDIFDANASTANLVNADGMATDQWSGSIIWKALPALTDFPAGDPLSYVAEQQYIKLNVVVPAGGPAEFADYDPLQPPVVGPPMNPAPTNAGGGAQSAGATAPSGEGAVRSNDEQNPTRFETSASIPNNSIGMAQTMQSAPSTTNLGQVVVVSSP